MAAISDGQRSRSHAVNAQSLLDDAELMSSAGRPARAYALAALAVEEVGKAAALSALALMPVSLRAQAPQWPLARMAPAEAGRQTAAYRTAFVAQVDARRRLPAVAALSAAVHDAVIGAAGPRAAGAGAVPEQHLGPGPAVQLHQVALRAAAVQPGVAEVVPEPVRVHPDPAWRPRRATIW